MDLPKVGQLMACQDLNPGLSDSKDMPSVRAGDNFVVCLLLKSDPDIESPHSWVENKTLLFLT